MFLIDRIEMVFFLDNNISIQWRIKWNCIENGKFSSPNTFSSYNIFVKPFSLSNFLHKHALSFMKRITIKIIMLFNRKTFYTIFPNQQNKYSYWTQKSYKVVREQIKLHDTVWMSIWYLHTIKYIFR